MANTHKFVVKNGLRADNIQFTDSASGLNQINVNMLNNDTLSFSGDAGQLFSITDTLSGTLFSVNDVSGIPSIEVDDQGIIKLAEFNGKVLINTTDSGLYDSDVLNVGGIARIDANAANSRGVTIKSGAIQIRTDSAEGYVDFYCEVNNAHRVRVKSPAHSAYSGQVDVVLPTSSGTLALTSQIPSTASFLTASSTHTLTNKTFDANGAGNSINNLEVTDFAGSAIVTESEGIGSNDNDTTLPTSAAVKDYVDNNAGSTGVTIQDEGSSLTTAGTTLNFVGAGVVASGTGTTKTITISGGGSGVTVQDEGSNLSTAGTILNFVGSGVTATGSGATKTITISGGGGGGGGITAADAIIRSFLFG